MSVRERLREEMRRVQDAVIPRRRNDYQDAHSAFDSACALLGEATWALRDCDDEGCERLLAEMKELR